jgi:hypothetical protein
MNITHNVAVTFILAAVLATAKTSTVRQHLLQIAVLVLLGLIVYPIF